MLGGTKLWLKGQSGTYYYYAHLQSYAEGMAEGTLVNAGDVVGFVGDSGNAQGGAPHLHFQVHPNGGEPVNPYGLLTRGRRPVPPVDLHVVDLTASLEADCSPETLFEWVGGLDTYDRWLEIVPRTTDAAPIDGDPGPAWDVTLRGRIGPLARSKRLRMVRTEHRPPAGDQPGRAVFERRETDGRDHATWRLGATVEATPDRQLPGHGPALRGDPVGAAARPRAQQ